MRVMRGEAQAGADGRRVDVVTGMGCVTSWDARADAGERSRQGAQWRPGVRQRRGWRVNARDRKTLLRVRTQARVVRELGERLNALAPGALKSVVPDGMPHARGGVPSGLDVLTAKRDSLMRIVSRECELLRKYDDAARKVLDRMRPELYAFCVLYYIGGLDLSEVAAAVDRSERQCMRYRREIEQEERETVEDGAQGRKMS